MHIYRKVEILRGVDQQSTQRGSAERLKIFRWGGREGGQLTVNSERICSEVENFRCGGRGSINSHFQRGSAERLKILGGEGGGGGVDQQPTQRGSGERLKVVGGEGGGLIDSQLREDLQRG